LTGCPLPAPELVGFPSDDPILECFVTVRNPLAEAAFGVDAVPEQTLSSRGGIFLDADGKVLRP
jgi:hypothetical protein